MNKKRRTLQLLADSWEDHSERKKEKQQRIAAETITMAAGTIMMPGREMELNFESKIKERLAKDEAAYGAFLECWRLYKGGKMSKHDLCCEIISNFSGEIHDLVLDLHNFFKDSSSVVA